MNNNMQNVRTPKVSVLLSVYNSENYIRESIDSILTQTFENFELIIINDGSTDSSLDIIKSYKDSRIKLYNNAENVGLTKSLNYGLSVAKGEFIARQDADDISHPMRFEKQIKYLTLNKEIVVLGTQAKIIDSKGKLKRNPVGWFKPLNHAEIKWVCMFDSPFIHPSVMMRRKIILDDYNGYNNNFRTSQDYELWSRIVYEKKCANLEDQLLSFRFTSESVSSNYSQESIYKISNIMKNSIIKGSGQAPLGNIIEQWNNVLFSKYFKNEIDMSKISENVDSLYNEFCKFNNINKKHGLVLKEKYLLLIRISYLLIGVNKMLSLVIFLKNLRVDFLFTSTIGPKYLSRLCWEILAQYQIKKQNFHIKKDMI